MFEKWSYHILIFLSVTTIRRASCAGSDQNVNVQYGVDCSWPVHSFNLRCGSTLGDRQGIYEDFIEGCREKYGDLCDSSEERRITRSLRQPEFSMVSRTEYLRRVNALFRFLKKRILSDRSFGGVYRTIQLKVFLSKKLLILCVNNLAPSGKPTSTESERNDGQREQQRSIIGNLRHTSSRLVIRKDSAVA